MPKIATRPERPSDAAAIDALHFNAFGPGAHARAAYRVREQAPHLPELSFVTEEDGVPIGSVRMTPIAVGDRMGLLLGPLVVDPAHKNMGYGKALVRLAVKAGREAGWAFVILVGDEPYYGALGFTRLPPGHVRLPGPVDPARLLVSELAPGAAAGLAGMVSGRRLDAPQACPARHADVHPAETMKLSRAAGMR